MARIYTTAFLIPLIIFLLTGMTAIAASASEAPRIAREELKAMLDSPGLIIIDVRIKRDWKSSKLKIPGAVRENFLDVETWAKKYPEDKTIVLYCD